MLNNKQTKTAPPKDFVHEAECIVRAYLQESSTIRTPSNMPRLKKRISFSPLLLLSCAAFAAALALHFLA